MSFKECIANFDFSLKFRSCMIVTFDRRTDYCLLLQIVLNFNKNPYQCLE